MGLEAATYISELVATNPVGGVDNYATADDHLRLLKGVLQSTFPNANSAILPTPAEFNILDGALLSTAELNVLNGYTGNTADLNVLAGAAVAGITPTELAYLNGVTSAIQTQLDGKAASVHTHATGDITSGTFADARIAASNVTQHVGAINHDALLNYSAAQHRVINDLGTLATELWSASKISTELAGKAASSHTHAAGDVTSGTFANARISAASVTQHAGSIDHNSLLNYQVGQHRTINDVGTAVTDLWSANKINTELAGKSDTGHTHAASDINSGTFADARIAASNVTQHVGSINHDLLLGFVANEHLDWTTDRGATNIHPNNYEVFNSTTIGSVPASGGGTTNYLRADGTWAAPPGGGGEINDLTASVTWANVPNANITQSSVTQHVAAINHDALLNFVANEHIDHSTVSITAGTGLSGGGTIAATRTLNLDVAGLTNFSGATASSDSIIINDGGVVKEATFQNLPSVVTSTASTAYSWVAADGNGNKKFTAGTAVTATIPANASVAYPIGTTLTAVQMGAGQITWAITTDTLRSPNGTKSSAQYTASTALKVDTTEWVLLGDVTT